MKEDIQKGFDAVFSAHEAKQLRAKQAVEAQKSKEELFLEKFKSHVTSTIKPAFESVKTYLQGKGIEARVYEEQDRTEPDGRQQSTAGIAMTLLLPDERSGRVSHGTDTPTFRLSCSKRQGTVNLWQSTMAPGRGGQAGSEGEFNLEQVTEEFAHQKLLKWVSAVFK